MKRSWCCILLPVTDAPIADTLPITTAPPIAADSIWYQVPVLLGSLRSEPPLLSEPLTVLPGQLVDTVASLWPAVPLLLPPVWGPTPHSGASLLSQAGSGGL